jgi:DNA invertase Pin-like site-specific DNA recombinase
MKKALIYARVSSQEQAVSDTALPSQVKGLQKFVEQEQIALYDDTNCACPGVFVDPGVSASKVPLFNRPGFVALWACLNDGDSVVAESMSRMFRSALDFAQSWQIFEKRGINLIFQVGQIDMSSATGKLIASVMAAFAQFKTDIMSERIREGHAAKKRAVQEGREYKKHKPAADPVKPTTVSQVVAQFTKKEKEEKPKGRIWSYARVSTDGQTTESQMATIERLESQYMDQGYQVVEQPYEEQAVSAYRMAWRERPMGKVIFNGAQKGDVIIAARLDRMFRSIWDMCGTLQELEERGVSVRVGNCVATDTPAGRMMLGLLGVMSEFESAEHSEKMTRIFEFCRAERGKWLSATVLPSWLRVHKDEKGEVSFVPCKRLIRDILLLKELSNSGLKHEEACDELERISAARENRPILPSHKAPQKSLSKKIKREYGEEAQERFRLWCKVRGITEWEELSRPMSYEYARDVLRKWDNSDLSKYIETLGPEGIEAIMLDAAQLDAECPQWDKKRNARLVRQMKKTGELTVSKTRKMVNPEIVYV